MISEQEAGKLSKLIAARDKRTIGDADLDLWLIMSQAGGWTYRQAVRAFVEHTNSRPGEWFEPGHVTQRVAELRKQIRERWYCPDPPRELGSDPRSEIEWRRQAAEEFVQRNLDRWASGQPLEELRPVLESGGGVIQMFSGDSVAKRAALAEVRRFAQSHSVSGKRRGQAS